MVKSSLEAVKLGLNLRLELECRTWRLKIEVFEGGIFGELDEYVEQEEEIGGLVVRFDMERFWTDFKKKASERTA